MHIWIIYIYLVLCLILGHLFQVTSEEVVLAFIQRTKDINPILNCAVDTCFDEAIEEAKSIDVKLK